MKSGVGILLGMFFLNQGLSGAELPQGRPSAQVGLGLQRTGVAQVSGGVNLVLGQVVPTPGLPLDLGLSGRVAVAREGVAAGVFGTARWSWKSLRTSVDWVDRLDVSLGLGMGLVPFVGLDAYGAVGYHLDTRWTILLEGTPYGGVLGLGYLF